MKTQAQQAKAQASVQPKAERQDAVNNILNSYTNTTHQLAVKNGKEVTEAENSNVVQRVKTISVSEDRSQALIDPGKTKSDERTHGWKSSFIIYLYNDKTEEPKVRVCIFINTAADDEVFDTWNTSVKNAWSNKFAIESAGETYPISVELIRSKGDDFKNYTVENVKQDKVFGKRGLFGTEHMTKWGESDSQDIPHEVGHMLGNKDEYGTVDGINEGAKHNELDPTTYSIMFKGDEPPRLRHFNLIYQQIIESGHLVNPRLIKYVPGIRGSSAAMVLSPQGTSAKKAPILPLSGSSGSPGSGTSLGKTSVVKPFSEKTKVSTGMSGSGFGSEIESRLHEKRVVKITDYAMSSTLSSEHEQWLISHNDWVTNPITSKEAIVALGL